MAGFINSLPSSGLLGLFQIKSDGASPKPNDLVQFTFSADQYYYRSIETTVAFSGISLAQGNNVLTGLTVPQARGWIITGFGIAGVTTAAQYIRGYALVLDANGRGVTKLSNDFNSSLQATLVVAQFSGHMAPLDVVVASPGSSITAFCQNVTAGPVTGVAGSVRYIDVPWS